MAPLAGVEGVANAEHWPVVDAVVPLGVDMVLGSVAVDVVAPITCRPSHATIGTTSGSGSRARQPMVRLGTACASTARDAVCDGMWKATSCRRCGLPVAHDGLVVGVA